MSRDISTAGSKVNLGGTAIRSLGTPRAKLGEGPYWDSVDAALYFVDIRGSAIWRYSSLDGSFKSWQTPCEPAAISRTSNDLLVVALADGFYDFDPETSSFDRLARVRFTDEVEQINDAKVDRQGRFVAVTTNNRAGRPVAGIYSFDGAQIVKLDGGLTIGNGPCWSPDGATFYVADTGPDVIYSYDYDVTTGQLSNKRIFADTSDVEGSPDGATVDADGRIWWSFVKGGGEVVCYNPDGTVHIRLQTGLRWTTSIQFGGDRMDSIYLTTLDPHALGLSALPEAEGGALFVVESTGITGLVEPPVRMWRLNGEQS
jgi:sugar lactone lactonase YvrE